VEIVRPEEKSTAAEAISRAGKSSAVLLKRRFHLPMNGLRPLTRDGDRRKALHHRLKRGFRRGSDLRVDGNTVNLAGSGVIVGGRDRNPAERAAVVAEGTSTPAEAESRPADWRSVWSEAESVFGDGRLRWGRVEFVYGEDDAEAGMGR
jgi:hypothetical protein